MKRILTCDLQITENSMEKSLTKYFKSANIFTIEYRKNSDKDSRQSPKLSESRRG